MAAILYTKYVHLKNGVFVTHVEGMDSSNAVKSGISVSVSEPILSKSSDGSTGARIRQNFFFGSIPDRNEAGV